MVGTAMARTANTVLVAGIATVATLAAVVLLGSDLLVESLSQVGHTLSPRQQSECPPPLCEPCRRTRSNASRLAFVNPRCSMVPEFEAMDPRPMR